MQENVPMREIIGFIGLGGMGVAMATNLLRAGFAREVSESAGL
jgi:3-hydroxyisobutyrate dehydrogenase-like beta-hydroxyacid dehydrogenase